MLIAAPRRNEVLLARVVAAKIQRLVRTGERLIHIIVFQVLILDRCKRLVYDGLNDAPLKAPKENLTQDDER